jgi:glycosyltransferase involved in cell wall biosynthesis
MIGIAPAFGRMYGHRPAGFLIYPCWTIEDRNRSNQVIEAAIAHRAAHPEHELVFLCNTGAERDLLAAAGLEAHLLNHNVFVSESVFRPLPDVRVAFDAIYNARLDPAKRHELASAIERVAYLSYQCPSAGPFAAQRKLMSRLLRDNPGHVLLNRLVDGLPDKLPPEGVNAALNRAAVGLCLSSVEGANCASVEYLLAGLPVVSTPSVGGREVYFDHEFCTICDADPQAVRMAVDVLKARQIPRDYIRARTLAKLGPDRHRFLSLIDDLVQRLGGKRKFAERPWPFDAGQPIYKDYRDHLQAFADGPDILGAAQQSGPYADIKRLLIS